MNPRTHADLRELFDRSLRSTRDPAAALMAVYDAGRFDAKGVSVSAGRHLEALCDARGISPDAILARDPSKRISRVRHELVWILRTVDEMSWPEIAKETKRVNHAAAMNSYRAVEARIAEDPGLRGELLGIAGVVERAKLRSVG